MWLVGSNGPIVENTHSSLSPVWSRTPAWSLQTIQFPHWDCAALNRLTSTRDKGYVGEGVPTSTNTWWSGQDSRPTGGGLCWVCPHSSCRCHPWQTRSSFHPSPLQSHLKMNHTSQGEVLVASQGHTNQARYTCRASESATITIFKNYTVG